MGAKSSRGIDARNPETRTQTDPEEASADGVAKEDSREHLPEARNAASGPVISETKPATASQWLKKIQEHEPVERTLAQVCNSLREKDVFPSAALQAVTDKWAADTAVITPLSSIVLSLLACSIGRLSREEFSSLVAHSVVSKFATAFSCGDRKARTKTLPSEVVSGIIGCFVDLSTWEELKTALENVLDISASTKETLAQEVFSADGDMLNQLRGDEGASADSGKRITLGFDGPLDTFRVCATFYAPAGPEGLHHALDISTTAVYLYKAILYAEKRIKASTEETQRVDSEEGRDSSSTTKAVLDGYWRALSSLRDQLAIVLSCPANLMAATTELQIPFSCERSFSPFPSSSSTFSAFVLLHNEADQLRAVSLKVLHELREIWFATGKLSQARRTYETKIMQQWKAEIIDTDEAYKVLVLLSDFSSFLNASTDTMHLLKMAYLAALNTAQKNVVKASEIESAAWLVSPEQVEAEVNSLLEAHGQGLSLDVSASIFWVIFRMAVKAEDVGSSSDAHKFMKVAQQLADFVLYTREEEEDRTSWRSRLLMSLIGLGRTATYHEPLLSVSYLLRALLICTATENNTEEMNEKHDIVVNSSGDLEEFVETKLSDRTVRPECVPYAIIASLCLEIALLAMEEESASSIAARLSEQYKRDLLERYSDAVIEEARRQLRECSSLGHFKKGLDRARLALDLSLKSRNESSLDVAAIRQTLSVAFSTCGLFKEAWDTIRTSHGTYIQAFPKRHPELRYSFERIGNSLFETGYFEQAVGPLHEAYVSYVSLFGDGDKHIDNILYTLCTVERSAGQNKQAQKDLLYLLRTRLKRDGLRKQDYRSLGNMFNKLAETCFALENVSEALRYHSCALGMFIADATEIPELPDVSSTVVNCVLSNKGEHLGSEDLQVDEKTEDVEKLISSGRELVVEDVASTLDSVAVVLKETGSTALAIDAFQAALTVKRRIYGSRHPEIGKTLFNLAEALENEADVESALQTAELAYDILAETLGEGSALTERVLSLLEGLEKAAKEGDETDAVKADVADESQARKT